MTASLGKTKTNSYLCLPSRVNNRDCQQLIENANAVRPSVPFHFHHLFSFVRTLTCCRIYVSPKPKRLEIPDVHYRNNQAVRIQKRNLKTCAVQQCLFSCLLASYLQLYIISSPVLDQDRWKQSSCQEYNSVVQDNTKSNQLHAVFMGMGKMRTKSGTDMGHSSAAYKKLTTQHEG